MPGGTAIRVQVLGEVRVFRGEHPLDLGPAKQRAVFAALALQPGETVSAGALREAVWGPAQPKSARQVVQTYVARLRHVLEPDLPPRGRVHVIGSSSAGYRLAVEPGQVDVTRFRTLCAEARARATQDPPRSFELLGAALRQWRDPQLAELARLLHTDEAVAATHRAWCDAALDYVRAGLGLGRGAAVLAVAEQLARCEPLHEEVQARYIAALEQSGRRAAALDQFHHVRARLGDELGVTPGAQLAGAYRKIVRPRTPAPAGPRPDPPPWRGPGAGPGTLVGRDADLVSVTGRLAEDRLLTLTGAPGCGKSALALHAATAVRDRFPGGVLVLEASEIPGAAGLAEALARLTGGQAGDDAAALLGDRRTLLVLDNVEHLVAVSAAAADRLIRSVRRVSVLVTSRERLGLPYETVWPVQPLEVGGHDGATALFARRAAQVSPGFRLTRDNTDQVADICRRLDGLPLAIEMAAACLAAVPLDELTERTARPLDEITPPRRYPPAHQRSLRSTLRRSADCLSAAERRCLHRLAGLTASFGPADAALAWDGLPGGPVDVRAMLSRLVDASLLSVLHSGTGTRYRMLRLVRCSAAELGHSCPLPG
ncbi:AfsR/SARP family transcriptional regulator [Symbioplanes lichenis]|uniref:AfsR/SARP family transcriptional regulator n=1 Tax=Symbioplanes lichenis TaxID=1629072 RepID=UPI0027398DC2|nr:BTAD domain-containing putative transcriptional regulator [Actinoplanes lichenis]